MTDDNERVMDRKVYAADQIIFHEGKPGNSAYIVQEGEVEIFKTINGGQKVTLGLIEAGGLFGELALVDKAPRMASARAAQHTVLISISRRTFDKKLNATDRFMRAVLRILLGNYRTVVRRAVAAETKLKEHGIPLD
ncbi:cyclic nucleotide-binding domain-containing protein [Thalassospira sp. MA62]|nr:cyclic nucleotide-binding domain-containing protein [Thalassospira sp. MA62]